MPKICKSNGCYLCRSGIFEEKSRGYLNNHEKSSTTKAVEHIPSSFAISIISSLKSIKNKHNVYIWEDCMRQFCRSLFF